MIHGEGTGYDIASALYFTFGRQDCSTRALQRRIQAPSGLEARLPRLSAM